MCKRQKKLYFIKDYFLPLCPTKFYYWKVFSPNFNNISEQDCTDKSVFSWVKRLNYSSPINNTITNKIKHFPQLYSLGPQISLKPKWHHFLP